MTSSKSKARVRKAAQDAQDLLTKKQNLGQAIFMTALGVVIILGVVAALIFLFSSIGGPMPSELVPRILGFWFLLSIPGFVYIAWGIWYYTKWKRVESVVSPRTWKDYGIVLLQLLPGVVVSAGAIYIDKTDPELAESIGHGSFDAMILALTTATSVVMVRRAKDKV